MTSPNSQAGLTDLSYTGQRDLGMGLMDYKARFYSPVLGRFTQPDTLIPGADNPQAWNRFSYVMNSSILYNDPSGHMIDDGCRTYGCGESTEGSMELSRVTKDKERRKSYFEKAIEQAIKEYNIDMSTAEGILYDPTTSSDGETIAETDQNRIIKIGDNAFTGSAGRLASYIYHETIHTLQWAEGRNSPGTMLDEGPQMNETEAYGKQLNFAESTGLSGEELSGIEQNLESFYDSLEDKNKDRYNRGLYFIDP